MLYRWYYVNGKVFGSYEVGEEPSPSLQRAIFENCSPGNECFWIEHPGFPGKDFGTGDGLIFHPVPGRDFTTKDVHWI